MELQKFIELFAEQFEDTDIEEFNSGTVFKNLEEWDSLTSLSVIAMIDEEMDKRITGDHINQCSTIEDLYNIVMS
jgi:acyl carrier protein